MLLLGGCSQNDSKAQLNIELTKGTIRLIKDNDYLVQHEKDSIVLKNVKTFIIFNGVPYFELQGGKIFKWTNALNDKGFNFNLQQVWDKLYYITQTVEGVEVDKYYLNIIDRYGKLSTVELKHGNERVNAENYCILADRLFVDDSYYEFCVSDKSKKIIKCYQWPDVPKQ